jgi:branched-subunit amino acid transport protein AzlD
MFKNFTRLFNSAVIMGILLVISIFIVKTFKLWKIDYLAPVLTASISFLLYFLIFTFLKKKSKQKSIDVFISPKFIIWTHWIATIVFLSIAALTVVLMLRDGSFEKSEIIKVTSTYLNISFYWIGGILGFYRISN